MFQSGLTINNFYAFLIELALSGLFLVLFGSIHYNVSKNKKIEVKLESKKSFKFIYFLIFGVLLSSFAFLLSQLLTVTIDTNIGLPMVILGLVFAMSFFYSSAVQVGAIIPSIFWVLIESGAFKALNTACLVRLIAVCVLALISLIVGLFKEKKWLIFILGVIAFLGAYIILIVWTGIDNPEVYIVEAFVGALVSAMFFAICKSFNKMLLNISKISSRATYMDKHFLVPSLINEMFTHFARKNPSQQILVCTIDDSKIRNPQVKAKLGDYLYNVLRREKTLLFKTPENYFAFALANEQYFISDLNFSYKGNLLTRRNTKDSLSNLEKLLLELPSEVANNIKCYTSVYGVHSYDVNELIWFNQFMIKNEDLLRSNIIKLFNSNMINHIKNDRISYAALVSQANLEEFDVELEKIQFNNDKEIYICPRFYWTKKLTCDFHRIMAHFDNQTANTLLRHLAIKSIELYESSEYKGQYKLLIYYPIGELTSAFFSINNIINKLRLYGLNTSDVIFGFSCRQVSTWQPSVIRHLKKFEERNMQYFLTDLVSVSALSILKPKIVIFDQSVLPSKTQLKKFLQFAKQHNQNVLVSSR